MDKKLYNVLSQLPLEKKKRKPIKLVGRYKLKQKLRVFLET